MKLCILILTGCSNPVSGAVYAELESIENERKKWHAESSEHGLKVVKELRLIDTKNIDSAKAKQREIIAELNVIGYEIYKNASRIHGAEALMRWRNQQWEQ